MPGSNVSLSMADGDHGYDNGGDSVVKMDSSGAAKSEHLNAVWGWGWGVAIFIVCYRMAVTQRFP